jgi:hypothetical protein
MTRTTVEYPTEWTIAASEDDRSAETESPDEKTQTNAKVRAGEAGQKPPYLTAGA